MRSSILFIFLATLFTFTVQASFNPEGAAPAYVKYTLRFVASEDSKLPEISSPTCYDPLLFAAFKPKSSWMTNSDETLEIGKIVLTISETWKGNVKEDKQMLDARQFYVVGKDQMLREEFDVKKGHMTTLSFQFQEGSFMQSFMEDVTDGAGKYLLDVSMLEKAVAEAKTANQVFDRSLYSFLDPMWKLLQNAESRFECAKISWRQTLEINKLLEDLNGNL
ncbi:MAG: hypothetical protein ACPGXY_00800 [Alphaproteobacteria bacterium]